MLRQLFEILQLGFRYTGGSVFDLRRGRGRGYGSRASLTKKEGKFKEVDVNLSSMFLGSSLHCPTQHCKPDVEV